MQLYASRIMYEWGRRRSSRVIRGNECSVNLPIILVLCTNGYELTSLKDIDVNMRDEILQKIAINKANFFIVQAQILNTRTYTLECLIIIYYYYLEESFRHAIGVLRSIEWMAMICRNYSIDRFKPRVPPFKGVPQTVGW
jgi:hypothetical protein